jgi:hypothetical protein
MITHERLKRTTYGRGLLDVLRRQQKFRVLTWSGTSSDPDHSADRVSTGIDDADVVSSLRPDGRHMVILDIDHPAWLMPSTNPNRYHLYIDTPDGLDESSYFALLDLLGRFEIIERGYARASAERGFSCVRLPWVEKEDPS